MITRSISGTQVRDCPLKSRIPSNFLGVVFFSSKEFLFLISFFDFLFVSLDFLFFLRAMVNAWKIPFFSFSSFLGDTLAVVSFFLLEGRGGNGSVRGGIRLDLSTSFKAGSSPSFRSTFSSSSVFANLFIFFVFLGLNPSILDVSIINANSLKSFSVLNSIM